MPLLSTNDDVTIPGVVVCLHVATNAIPDEINPETFHYTLRCWAAVAGRIEDGRWTREKMKQSTNSDEFWTWLNFVRLVHRPVWIFCDRLPTVLTVLSLWSAMESGEFSLHRRPTEAVKKIRRRKGRKNPEQAIPGILVTSGPPDVVSVFHRDGWKLNFLNSANYFSTHSAYIAVAEDGSSPTVPSPTAPLANWLQHCAMESATLASRMTALISWHKSQELGRFGFSVAGIALAAFRHRFMLHHIYTPDSQDDRDTERLAYYPGRVEAFWAGKVEHGRYRSVYRPDEPRDLFGTWPKPPYYLLDARSFYGAIGAFCDLPYRAVDASPVEGDVTEPGSGRISEYLAGVTIESGSDTYPLRRNERLQYARGHFSTVLCGPELSRAHQRGHIRRWHWWRRYALGRVFGPYSCALWEQRLGFEMKGDLTCAEFAKQLLARLHGKFLQKSPRWEPRPEMFAVKAWDEWSEVSASTGKARRFRAVAHDVEEKTDGGDKSYCFPALAAWVTAWGREWLHKWISMAGKGNVLYVSTDSLIVTENGKSNLKHAGQLRNSDLGALRVADVTDRIHLRGPNNYEFGDRCVVSGRVNNLALSHDGQAPGHQIDSLETVLHVRHGHTICSHPQPFQVGSHTIRQKIDSDGWLEPYELRSK